MSKEERFEELWSDYLEGELDEAGIQELRELMEKDEELVELAADTFQTHRLLGLSANENSEAFIEDTLSKLPESSGEFTDKVISKLPASPNGQSIFLKCGWGVAAMLVIGFFLLNSNDEDTAPDGTGARFASLSQAQFFGELTPAADSNPELGKNYTLLSGMVELAFPDGATAIIEAPALFRVVSDERMAMDVGHCSVHAPPGAEGFQVDTPVSKVIDRGTRFYVNVSESSETEVQVIEGAADVSPDAGGGTLRLTDGQARRVGTQGTSLSQYSPAEYRKQLPDRIISYEASKNEEGRAVMLKSVRVQRGGEVRRYPVEDLIPMTLTTFRNSEERTRIVHLLGGPEVPEERTSLLEDYALNTGVINPQGSKVAPSPGFSPEETPGFSIRFQRPVRNGPGPDIVFFEIQTTSNPPQGDAFHISPIELGENLHSHTVRSYDLQLTMPEALQVSEFHLYQFPSSVSSLEELAEADWLVYPNKLNFQAIAEGIDLDDLGYEEGATVEELFFQDALDDQHYVDPVFIAGLP